MLLMELEEFRLTYYAKQSQPHKRTLIRWIKNGTLPGKRQGRSYFIDVDKLETRTGNPLVDKVLENGWIKVTWGHLW